MKLCNHNWPRSTATAVWGNQEKEVAASYNLITKIYNCEASFHSWKSSAIYHERTRHYASSITMMYIDIFI